MTIIRGSGTTSARPSPTAKKCGVRTTIRVRINTNCLADGAGKTRSEAVLEQLGRGALLRSLPK